MSGGPEDSWNTGEVVHGRARSPGGFVHAEVTSDGHPVRLLLSPDAMKLSAVDLAADILAAQRAAHTAAVEAMLSRVEDLRLTPDTASLRATRETIDQMRSDTLRQAAAAKDEFSQVRDQLQNVLRIP